jgi:hypothetical protein
VTWGNYGKYSTALQASCSRVNHSETQKLERHSTKATLCKSKGIKTTPPRLLLLAMATSLTRKVRHQQVSPTAC